MQNDSLKNLASYWKKNKYCIYASYLKYVQHKIKKVK